MADPKNWEDNANKDAEKKGIKVDTNPKPMPGTPKGDEKPDFDRNRGDQ